MYSDFKSLKKASSLGQLTEQLVKEAEKMSNKSSSKDDRIFTLERDQKTGNGFAIIRFMPPPPNEPSAFVKLVNHNFNYEGKYLNENCPKHTPGVGGDCPICDSNRQLWATEIKENQNIASLRKLKTSYYFNIYVVKNPANPELEGTVMLYRCGVKIFEKLENARKPKYDGDTNIIEPFDLFEDGANFRLVAKTVKEAKNNRSYPDYSDSNFESKGALLGGNDAALEKLWKQCHSLQEIVSPAKFKSYDEIQKNLNRVMGANQSIVNSVVKQEDEFNEVSRQINDEDIMEELERQYKNNKVSTQPKVADEFDDALSEFEKLNSDAFNDDDMPF